MRSTAAGRRGASIARTFAQMAATHPRDLDLDARQRLWCPRAMALMRSGFRGSVPLDALRRASEVQRLQVVERIEVFAEQARKGQLDRATARRGTRDSWFLSRPPSRASSNSSR